MLALNRNKSQVSLLNGDGRYREFRARTPWGLENTSAKSQVCLDAFANCVKQRRTSMKILLIIVIIVVRTEPGWCHSKAKGVNP
jgi:hypothetical protein